MGNFKIWLETDDDPMPQMGSNTPASDEVIRTNKQPQVDSHEINPENNADRDKTLAIDGMIERFDMELPDSDSTSVNKFRKMWAVLRDQWDEYKTKGHFEKSEEGDEKDSLGMDASGQKMADAMRSHPNMVLRGKPGDYPNGPGTFGD